MSVHLSGRFPWDKETSEAVTSLAVAAVSQRYDAMLRVCYQRLREGSTISEAMTFEAWKKLIAEQAEWPNQP